MSSIESIRRRIGKLMVNLERDILRRDDLQIPYLPSPFEISRFVLAPGFDDEEQPRRVPSGREQWDGIGARECTGTETAPMPADVDIIMRLQGEIRKLSGSEQRLRQQLTEKKDDETSRIQHSQEMLDHLKEEIMHLLDTEQTLRRQVTEQKDFVASRTRFDQTVLGRFRDEIKNLSETEHDLRRQLENRHRAAETSGSRQRAEIERLTSELVRLRSAEGDLKKKLDEQNLRAEHDTAGGADAYIRLKEGHGQLQQAVHDVNERCSTSAREYEHRLARQDEEISHQRGEISRLQKIEEKLRGELAEKNNNKRAEGNRAGFAKQQSSAARFTEREEEYRALIVRLEAAGAELRRQLDAAVPAADKEKLSRLEEENRDLIGNERILKKSLDEKDTELYELTSSTSEFLEKAMNDQETNVQKYRERAVRLLREKRGSLRKLRTGAGRPADGGAVSRERELEDRLKAKEEEVSRLYIRVQEHEQKLQEFEEKAASVHAGAPSVSVEGQVNTARGSENIIERFVGWMKKPVMEVDEAEDPDE